MLPDPNGTVEALEDDPGSSTPSARTSPKHILTSEDNNHDDSGSANSKLSTIRALDNSNNSDSRPSVKDTNSKGVSLRPNSKAPKKTLGKRLRAGSNASSASSNVAAVPTKKRVRSNALTRSAPLATSTTTPGGLAGNSEFMYVYSFSLTSLHKDSRLDKHRNFTATIFIIQLGPDGPQFHAHESVLKRSPKLAGEIEKAKANKRATKQNTLPLMNHDAIAFEQMLQFLYKDKFFMSKNKKSPDEHLGELKEVMSLAKHYILPGLQKQVVKYFSSSRILGKIPPRRFFDWAEDMYYEELDHENGPFKLYLSKVAPTLLKGADGATRKELVGMVKQGGGFAEQLFIAAVTVSSLCSIILGLESDCFRHWMRRQILLLSRKRRT